MQEIIPNLLLKFSSKEHPDVVVWFERVGQSEANRKSIVTRILIWALFGWNVCLEV
jgi:hypothetical protein